MQLLCRSQLEVTFTHCKFVGLENTLRLHCINTLDASFMQLLCRSQLEDTFTLCKFAGLGNTLRLRSIVLFMQLLCRK